MKTITRTTFVWRSLCLAVLVFALPGCSKGDGESLKGRVTSSGPVGVFFMTRYWSGGPLEFQIRLGVVLRNGFFFWLQDRRRYRAV